jgi:hypothetical protein
MKSNILLVDANPLFAHPELGAVGVRAAHSDDLPMGQ